MSSSTNKRNQMASPILCLFFWNRKCIRGKGVTRRSRSQPTKSNDYVCPSVGWVRIVYSGGTSAGRLCLRWECQLPTKRLF
jgi:hypothetical protein